MAAVLLALLGATGGELNAEVRAGPAGSGERGSGLGARGAGLGLGRRAPGRGCGAARSRRSGPRPLTAACP